MARFFDNIKSKFTEGLKSLNSKSEVKRMDFCVGNFNLRGWNIVINEVDNIEGDYVNENEQSPCQTFQLY